MKILRRRLVLWDASAHDAKPYECTIIYRAADPFAVTLLVPDHDSNDIAEVLFARGLLVDGFGEPTGDGAVRVEPHIVDRDYMTLTLPTTRDGKEFYTDLAPLQEFVDDTCALVPFGSELPPVKLDLDRWLTGATS